MEVDLISKQNDQEDDSFLPNGRKVCLGDLYDYTSDTILNREVLLCPKISSSIKTEFDTQSKEKFTFFFRQPQLCKWLHLGIDHQQQCCMAFSANMTGVARYWFSEYLDYHPSESTASVILHFRFQGYKSSLSSSIINASENVVTEGTRATHVVKEIVYGFNGLLILELPNCKPEMYEAIEDRLFLTAKCLAAKRQVPRDLLQEVQCRFYTDMPGSTPQSFPLAYFCSTGLPKILKRMRKFKMQIPVYANLAPLENSAIQTCREEQRLVDSTVLFAVLQNTISTFRSDCQGLLDDPFVQRNSRTRYYLEYFLDCLEQLCNLINKTTIRYPNWNSNQVYSRLSQFWLTYFASGTIAEWILQRKMGLSVLKSLLNDIEFPFLSMASIVSLNGPKKVFMFKTNKAPDELFKQFCTDLNQLPGTPEWSVLEIVSKPMEHIETIRAKLESFVKSVDENKSIQYFISSSSAEEDGTILCFNSQRTTSILPMGLNYQQEFVIPGTRLFSKGNPSIFLLQTEGRSDTRDLRWLELGVKTVPRHQTLLLMGATGCGKSSLVDSIINYMLGVQWTDPFRFRIEAERNNSGVTAYTIHYVNGMLNTLHYSLTIIDTPAYCGDSETDQKTTQLVRKFLAHENSRNIWKAVDFIGLVADETQKVSSASQNSVFEAIPALFGADKIPSVHWFCTFCSQSNSLPIVLEGVWPSSGISTDNDYQFGNTALFSSNQQMKNGDFFTNQKNWKIVWNNLKTFFHSLDVNRIKPTVQSVATTHKATNTILLGSPWTAEEMESLETIRVMENDIQDLLERMEKLYKKKPELANSKKLIKPQETLDEGEDDDENQYKLNIKLMKVLNETVEKIKILKDSGIKHRHIRRFKFRKNAVKACEYIRYLKRKTNPSPLRLRILDQVLTWSQHFNDQNNNTKINLSLVVQTSPAAMEEGRVNESNPTVLTIVT